MTGLVIFIVKFPTKIKLDMQHEAKTRITIIYHDAHAEA